MEMRKFGFVAKTKFFW